MSISSVLKSRRKELGLTLSQIADRIGVTEATVQRWESGNIKSLRHERIAKLAEILGVTPAILMGWEESPAPEPSFPSPNVTEDVVAFRVHADIAAGYEQPAEALADWEGACVDVPLSALRGRQADDYFVIRIKGDSMYPHYQDGDYVLVLKTSALERSGQVGVLLFGDEGTIKKIEYVQGEDWLRLIPFNPMYPTKTIEGVDLEQCRVIGVPRLLLRDL